jgi:hypothetical protein
MGGVRTPFGFAIDARHCTWVWLLLESAAGEHLSFKAFCWRAIGFGVQRALMTTRPAIAPSFFGMYGGPATASR